MIERRHDLDRIKTFTIALVVLGHLFGREPPPGGEWWYLIESYIYLFHMPVFMFFSGLVYFLADHPNKALQDYRAYLSNRATRLLLPFVLMGCLVVVGKIVASRFVHVDSAPSSVLEGMLGILGYYESPVRFIWYVLILFVFSCVTPLLYRIFHRKLYLLTFLAFIMFFSPAIKYFYIEYITKYYLFFLFGGVAAQNINKIYSLLERHAPLLYSAFAVASLSFLVIFRDLNYFYSSYFWVLVMSVTGISAIWAANFNGPLRNFSILDSFSKYVFNIYLFNLIFIGATKAIMSKIIPFNVTTMLLYMPILWGMGFFGPILLKKYVFRHIGILDKLTT